MTTIQGNKKRIAKNTLLLYLRQLLTLGLSLYTVRLTLAVLGVTDFGIYGAVAGFTSLLSIISTSMSTSTQRFMNIELARGNFDQLNRVYNSSLQIHIFLSLLFILIAETLGLWFIENKLTIPEERMNVVFWVYQLSILSSVLNLTNVPNQAAIIAHEDMGIFALFSILDAVLKIAAVAVLLIISWDHLLLYAIFLFTIQFINRTISVIFCKIRYREVYFRKIFDKGLFKGMFKLAGWNVALNAANLSYTQGINILLNIFFGPVLNAAYTVSLQAYSGLRMFCSNFQLASNPQLVKYYSIGDEAEMINLLKFISRMSFFLIFTISLPFLINADFVLELWLTDIPPHANNFFRLLIIYAFVDIFSYPMDIAAQATGRIKKYNSIAAILILSILLIGFVLFYIGTIPESIYVVSIIVGFFAVFVRLYYLSKLIHLNVKDYATEVLLHSLKIGAISVIIPIALKMLLPENTITSIANIIITFVFTIAVVYYTGLNNDERTFAINYLKKLKSKIKSNF